MASMHGKPQAGLAAGIAAISFGAIFTRLAAAPAPAVAALRMVFASLALAPFALGSARVRGELRGLSGRELALVGLAGSFLALHFILWISSLSFTGVTASVVFVTTNPLWVALFTIVGLRREVPRGFWPGLVLAIAGGIIIGGADAVGNAGRLKGDLLALGGAAAVAGYFLAGARLRERLSLLAYVVPVYAVAGVLLAAGAFAAKVPLSGYRWESYAFCVAMALVCQVGGHSLFNWALKLLPTPVVAMASLGEPVGASVLAFLILGESPRRSDVGGGVLILAGILVVMVYGSRALEPGKRVPSAS